MEKPYHPLFKGLAWNTFESIVYQTILIIHYLLLYRHTDPTLFGMMGVLFSTLYLMTFLVNGGLDTALAPYARSLTTDPHFWRQILLPQMLIQLLAYGLIGIGGIVVNQYLLTKTSQLPFVIATTLALLLISEATKKTVRTIAHLTFNNRIAALVEVGSLAVYVGIVWLWYASYKIISLTILFVPLLITSIISCLILAGHLYHMYRQLPADTPTPLPTHQAFIRTRLYTYGTHLGHILFSSNFLVPFFALHIGLAHVGVFKLISSITHTITSMMHKIFGPTSQAIFSHTFDRAHHEKQQLFFTITEQLHHVLYGFIIFFTINYHKLIAPHFTNSTSSSVLLILLFLIIQLTEHMFIVYEKFFIAHNRAAYLCILSLCSLAIIATLVLLPLHLSPITLMIIVLGIRILTIGIMGMSAYYLFHIQPALTLRIDYLAYAVCASLIFFIFF
jgi:hypothetical protein